MEKSLPSLSFSQEERSASRWAPSLASLATRGSRHQNTRCDGTISREEGYHGQGQRQRLDQGKVLAIIEQALMICDTIEDFEDFDNVSALCNFQKKQ